MDIREATESDIPTIVSLLKQSLGEDLMPKTDAYWRWKHVENPFGISPVLLCWEGGELVGVRAFMRWEWCNGGYVYQALRAVDTATHPDFQGKGIFKKLTLSLVDLCRQHGDHFIFNTPNQQSKPGYLKMGWIEAGRLPVRLSVEKPLKMLFNYVSPRATVVDEANGSIEYFLNHPGLQTLIDGHYQRMKTIRTNNSLSYLVWRYLKVPATRYLAVGDEVGGELRGLMLGRIKQTRWGRELRITDFFWNGTGWGRELMLRVGEMKKKWKIDYTTLSGTGVSAAKMLSSIGVNVSIGPTVTLRSLRLEKLDAFSNFSNWSPSLGDLELF